MCSLIVSFYLFPPQAKKKAQEERLANLDRVIKEKEEMDRRDAQLKKSNRQALEGKFALSEGKAGKSSKLSPHDALMSALMGPSSSSSSKNQGAIRKLPKV